MTARRIKVLLLVTATTVLALEGLLQAGSFLVWLVHGGETKAAARPDGKVVLCTGDSFTYGVGSTSRETNSYPAVLQRILRERTGDEGLTVVNCGWPGQDSAAVLRNLDGQLARWRPALVYVLAGCNDWWSRPRPEAEGEGAEEDGGRPFEWTWRTGRLLKLVVNWLRGGRDPRAAGGKLASALRTSPAGEWSLDDLRIRFGGDGTLSLSRSFPPIAFLRLSWSADGGALWISSGSGPLLGLAWEVANGRLLLRHPALAVPLVLDDCSGADGGPQAVLKKHARRVVRLCAQRGATPVLASYPAPMFGVEEAVKAVAEATNTGWLDLRREFDLLLRSRKREELFAADGHCTDEGYRAMAGIVARDALERLGAR